MILIELVAFYLPLEEFFLKWIPVPDNVYLWLRQLPDLLILLAVIFQIIYRTLRRETVPLIGKSADWILLAFSLSTFMTFILNPGVDLAIGLANWKALLRYVLLVYLLLLLAPSVRARARTVRVVMFAVGVQSIIGIIQYFGGSSVHSFLLPRVVEGSGDGLTRTFTGSRFVDENFLIGTMGDTISFGYLMLIGFVVSLNSRERNAVYYYLCLIIFLALLYLTGSRAVVLAAALIGFFYSLHIKNTLHKVQRLMYWTIIAFGAIVLSPIFLSSDLLTEDKQSFLYFLTPDYIEAAMNQRLGIVVFVLPFTLLNINLLFGFGPDKYRFAELLADAIPDLSGILLRVLPNVLEDVYWVALIVYYGLIGIALWLLFLRRIYLTIRPTTEIDSGFRWDISRIASSLFLAALLLNFFNQAYEARSFSFYLWLFVGLAVVHRRQNQKHSSRTLQH